MRNISSIGDAGNRWNDLHNTAAVKLAARAPKQWRKTTAARSRPKSAPAPEAVVATRRVPKRAAVGRAFGKRSLFRMVRFAEVFPDIKIVSALRGAASRPMVRVRVPGGTASRPNGSCLDLERALY